LVNLPQLRFRQHDLGCRRRPASDIWLTMGWSITRRGNQPTRRRNLDTIFDRREMLSRNA